MKLCIVMPVLNEGATLAARMQALQPLRARGVRVVVADGGSTDATWGLARAGADAVVLALRGRAAQMNAGARVAGGDVLLFLHADTVLPPDADALIARAMNGGAAWGRFDVSISGRPALLRVVAAFMNARSRLTGIATGDQAMFVRRDVFETLGGFAPQPLMEDVDLSTRLKKHDAPACLRERVTTSGRRWEVHGVWRTIVLMWRLRWAYWRGASPQALAVLYGYPSAPATAPMALAVLAKAPVPGLAKTRLIPELGARGAARAQRQFARHTLALAQQAASAGGPGVGTVTLWCAPDAQHRFFRALVRTTGVACQPQPAGDLGQRMAHAFAAHFAQHPGLPLLLMGTDCPLLAPGHLQQAAQALQTHDAVLIPAEDGGYVLIGLRRPVPEVLTQIAWSTPQVLAQTRARLQAAGATWYELPALWDVDEPADWARWQAVCGIVEP